MSFRFLALLALASCLPSAAAQAAERPPLPQPELQIGVVGDLEVGPDGAVRSYTITSDLAPPIVTLVERKVREWRFEPITVDGKPVIAQTRARLTLLAIPQGEDFQLRIEDVRFGEAAPSKQTKMPSYPREAIRDGIGARVLLSLRLDPDGRVLEVHPYQTSLNVRVRSDKATERARNLFERASVDAVKHWQFDMSETFDGVAHAQDVIVPVVFQVTTGMRAPREDEWKHFFPGPITPAPWRQQDTQLARLDAIAEGEARSLTSRFRLVDDVTGTLL